MKGSPEVPEMNLAGSGEVFLFDDECSIFGREEI
jgi:hypothetical protein